jgi:hypothetical protein
VSTVQLSTTTSIGGELCNNQSIVLTTMNETVVALLDLHDTVKNVATTVGVMMFRSHGKCYRRTWYKLCDRKILRQTLRGLRKNTQVLATDALTLAHS